MARRILTVALIAALAAAGCTSSTDESETTTTTARELSGPPVDLVLEGPIEGGTRGVPYNAMPEGFEEEHGYSEQEWFVSGTASSYEPVGELTADGEWTVAEADRAPFTTRIIVRRPEDPARFNGLVVVEWLNVTAGRDSDPDFGFLHPEIFEEGYAYVGVSAQKAGVDGEGILAVPGVPADALIPLKEWDPERYAPLEHPGDDFSYDLFTQIGALVEGRAADTPLGGLPVEHVLAVGQSQSAFRLVTYLDAVQSEADTYDGFLVHGRGADGAALGSDEASRPAGGTLIRTDLDVPALVVLTETDLTFLGGLRARQPDGDSVVTWEVAGTAHADESTLEYGAASGARWSDATVDLTALCGRANTGPQGVVLRAALEALRAWTVEGDAPPTAEPIEDDGAGSLVRDADGNVLGGVRTPAVDAPVATLTGEGNPSSIFCSLFGQTIPFTAERLAALYPTHDDYVEAVTASADRALEEGFLLEVDRDDLVAAAQESDVGGS